MAAEHAARRYLVAVLLGGAALAAGASAAHAQAAGAGAGAGAGAPAVRRAPDRFAIEAFDVSGVTQLSDAEVETLVYPFAGPDRSLDDVQAARKALQDAYARKGFEAVVVDVPVQPSETFGKGIVQLSVNEAPLGRLRVTGSRYHALSVVEKQVSSLAEGQPVNLKALQTEIAAANRFPDRSINPSFRAGAVPGTVDIDLKVSDERPLHATIELNNDNSPSTRPLRLSATARYTNLWQAGHTASFTYLVAPQRRSDSEVFSGSYVAPLIGTPWTFLVAGYKSNSNVAALGGSSVLGNGYQVGARAIYRLPSEGLSQTISFGADFKDFQQKITVAGAPAGSAPIRYIPLVGEYALGGATEKSNYAFTFGVTAGLRAIKIVRCTIVATGAPCPSGTRSDDACFGLDSNNPARCALVDQFRNREDQSNENFFHVNVGFDYSRALPRDFVGAFRVSGQYADSHLVTNEQFALGGLSNVRGYFQSEAVGDDGVSGSIELRSPSAATLLGSFVTEARLYAFVDGGYTHVRRALANQTADFGLLGVGGGGRIRLFDVLTGEVLVGVPLRSGPISDRGDPRVTFVVKGEF